MVWLPVWRNAAAHGTIPGGMADRVLIVDDHASFRASARALLESSGYEVVGEAADGAAALRAICELEPDAVLLDVQLPDMDGFDVVVGVADCPSAPAIVLTSSRNAEAYGSAVVASGARGFIAKSELTAAAFAALVQ